MRLMAVLRCRPAAALIVAAAIAMQAFLAGVATSGGVLAPGSTPAGFTAICHGGGPADQGNGTAPDPSRAKHSCCMSCTAAAPVLAGPPSVLSPQPGRSFKASVADTSAIVLARRAVRSGLSQAPLSQA